MNTAYKNQALLHSLVTLIVLSLAVCFIYSQDIYTSDFHKNHAGEIVFSKQFMTKGQETEDIVTNSFTCGDNIYARCLLDKTIGDFLGGNYIAGMTVNFLIFIDKDPSSDILNFDAEFPMTVIDQMLEWATTRMDVLPDEAHTDFPDQPVTFSKALMNMSPGKHKIYFAYVYKDIMSITTLAKGSFDYDCSEGTDKLVQQNKMYEDIKFEKGLMPYPKRKDPKLESEVLALCKKEWAKEKKTPLRVVCNYERWYDKKDDFDNILYQYIMVWIAYKKPDGTCEYVEMEVAQDYKGGDSYGKTYLNGAYWNRVQKIKCDNVMKDWK